VKNNPKNPESLSNLINPKEDFIDFNFDDSRITFIISDDKRFDFENAMMLYQNLKHLDLTTLTDERFWFTLIINKGYEYMTTRWGLDEETIIKYHWFYFTNVRRSVVFHGLARLFWRIKVSMDEENKEDPFKLSKFAFEKPEILKNSMFRGFMFHESTRLGYLDAMLEKSKNENIKINDIYMATKLMTKLGSASLLDIYSRNEIRDMMLNEMSEN
jgi:hypothetical protein